MGETRFAGSVYLSQKINELQTKLGPEYLALLEATK
jgi:hypothetical protein